MTAVARLPQGSKGDASLEKSLKEGLLDLAWPYVAHGLVCFHWRSRSQSCLTCSWLSLKRNGSVRHSKKKSRQAANSSALREVRRRSAYFACGRLTKTMQQLARPPCRRLKPFVQTKLKATRRTQVLQHSFGNSLHAIRCCRSLLR